jgi:hypothetical protein
VDGLSKNVLVQIDEHFISTDFLDIDMGAPPKPSSTLQQEKYISISPQRRYTAISIVTI